MMARILPGKLQSSQIAGLASREFDKSTLPQMAARLNSEEVLEGNSMFQKTSLLFAALVLAFPVFAEAKTLYVNNSGNPACSDNTTYAANSGSSPWCTIGRAAWGSANRGTPNAAEAARAGDTVRVQAGTYSGVGTNHRYSPLYNSINSGTAGNPITYEAVGTVNLTLSSGSGPVIGASSPALGFEQSLGAGYRNYIVWRGFSVNELTAAPRVDSGMAVLAGGEGNVLDGNTFIGDPASPILNNHAGIWLQGDTVAVNAFVVKNNVIRNILNGGAYQHNGACIMFYGVVGATIENNEIENCGSGVFVKGYDNRDNTIRRNIITRAGHAIKLGTAVGTHSVYQNIIDNNLGTGISVNALVDTAIEGTVYIVNNTLVGGAYVNLVDQVPSPNTASVYVRNNITYNGRYKVEAAYGQTPSRYFFDGNVYNGGGSWYLYNNVEFTTLSAWQSGLGGCPGTLNDCASITSDPLFVDYAGGNYRLQAGSLARTIGTDILDHDGDGNTSEMIPAGAYITGNEIIGRTSATTTPPPSGSTVETPAGLTVCHYPNTTNNPPSCPAAL